VLAGEELEDAKELLGESGDDPEMKDMAKAEIKELEGQMEELEDRLMVLMLPQVSDGREQKDCGQPEPTSSKEEGL